MPCYPVRTLADNHLFAEPTEQDKYQYSLQWVPLDQLKNINLYPQKLKKVIPDWFKVLKTEKYLGDVN